MPVESFKVVESVPTILDYTAVDQGVTAREPFAQSREHAFQRYVLETVFDILPEDVDQHIVDGGQDRGIDMIYVDHAAKTISICSTKTVQGYKQSQKNYPGKEVDKLISFVDDLLQARDHLLDTCSDALAAMVTRVWDVLETGHYDVQVHLFSNQLPLAQHEASRLSAALGTFNVSLYEHHLYQLAHGVARSYTPQFSKSIRLIRTSPSSRSEGYTEASLPRSRFSTFTPFLRTAPQAALISGCFARMCVTSSGRKTKSTKTSVGQS